MDNQQFQEGPGGELEISVPDDFEGIPLLTEGVQEDILNPQKEEGDPSGVKFELPGFGLKAYKDFQQLTKEASGEASPVSVENQDGGRVRSGEPAQSVTDMAAILNRQAAKVHGEAPKRPQGKAAEGVETTGEKMIVGISGQFAGGAAPRKTPPPKAPVVTKFDDLLEFMEESIEQYNQYVTNIGRNGLAAVNLGYFRDDIQEVLDMLKYEQSLNLRPYWEIIVRIDLELRAKAPIYVREVGYENFKQYQIINDPPLTHWWWYLNRIVAPPAVQPKFWEIWKKI